MMQLHAYDVPTDAERVSASDGDRFDRQDLDIMDSEAFGPTLGVLRLRAEGEALKLAGVARHGVAAGIFAHALARCLRMPDAPLCKSFQPH